jgi:hypothetical protein
MVTGMDELTISRWRAKTTDATRANIAIQIISL